MMSRLELIWRAVSAAGACYVGAILTGCVPIEPPDGESEPSRTAYLGVVSEAQAASETPAIRTPARRQARALYPRFMAIPDLSLRLRLSLRAACFRQG